jgi:hypothetical protein
MIVLICFAAYILIAFGFCLWDALIGMPVKWSSWDTFVYYGPPEIPRGLAAIFWPIATPIVMLKAFSKFLEYAKEKRIKKEENKTRLRIAAQKELDTYMEQVEAEMKDIVRSAKR